MLLPQQLTILEESERLLHENAGFRRQLTELSQSREQLQDMGDELRYYQEQLRQQTHQQLKLKRCYILILVILCVLILTAAMVYPMYLVRLLEV